MKWRRRIFLVLWFLAFIRMAFWGGNLSYGFFWGLTLIPVISFIYLLLVFAQFRVYQEIESRNIVCKQPVSYYFILPNETFYSFAGLSVRLFSGFSYVTDMLEDEEYELLPGDEYTYHTKLVCKYRGEYEVGVREIIITDFFRLFRLKYKVHGTIKALVYPRIIQKKELDSMKDIINLSFQETSFTRVEPDVVTRDYVSGDSLKHIHWKVTAKEHKLKTRTLLGERKQGVLLVYDTKRYSKKEEKYIPLENQILEAVLALGFHFAEKNIPCNVVYGQNGLRQYQLNGMGQVEHWYQETSHIVFSEKECLYEVMQQLVQGRLHGNIATIMIVAHKPEERMMNLLQMLSVEGFLVLLYLITDENAEEYIRHGNSRLIINVLPVEADLEELL